MQCPSSQKERAAGTGTLGKLPTPQENASAICPWPAGMYDHLAPWGTHIPAAQCRIARNLCGTNHSSDYNASWLQRGILGGAATERDFDCVRGADGYRSIWDDAYDPTQPCV